MTEFHDRRKRSPMKAKGGVRQDPIPSNPELYPNGRCPVCGHGVNWAAECSNQDCGAYVPGAEYEE